MNRRGVLKILGGATAAGVAAAVLPPVEIAEAVAPVPAIDYSGIFPLSEPVETSSFASGLTRGINYHLGDVIRIEDADADKYEMLRHFLR